jgi:hypothetical protein
MGVENSTGGGIENLTEGGGGWEGFELGKE